MKRIRFNVDFEEVLAGKPSRPHLIGTLEFFAFWVTHNPVLIHRSYSSAYLKYIEMKTGHRPDISTQGEAENWWGDLHQFELMKELSSKTEFLKWWQRRWPLVAQVCHNPDELSLIVADGTYLVKKSDGMSGRGHCKVTKADLATSAKKIDWSHPVVVEPLYDRRKDVSALWIPEENQFIYYQNIIDQRFQWRGAILEKSKLHQAPSGTGEWSSSLADLQKEVQRKGYLGPFSVDAFFYQSSAGEVFHPGSEMNPRKTMGWLAYQFWKKSQPQFFKLALYPYVLTHEDWTKYSTSEYVELLSPEGNTFVWYSVSGESLEDLERKESQFLQNFHRS